jgi:serine/threonine-protein kinase CHEK2
MRPLFDAVVYCHALEIVHRDIKLENILLTSKELETAQVKITDFGLSKSLAGEQFATTLCGSPGYIAPEILNETPYD